jgi:uncharacterized protein YndB with AHSA1/START domain
MTHPFELKYEIDVPATPEEAWDAIATGPGVDSWFMGKNEVEPREGGKLRTKSPAFDSEATVTIWKPPERLEYRTSGGPVAEHMVFDYTIERRDKGSRIRWSHSGALGDDWEAQYEAMGEGDPMYFSKLGEYLTYFLGRTATPVDVWGPRLDPPITWEVFGGPLHLEGDVSIDEPVKLTPDGFDPIEGVVDCLSKSFFGVRTDDAMYRFIRGFEGSVLVGHHLFAEGIDEPAIEAAWKAWLVREFA